MSEPQPPLRDTLALERTALASERTLLAYVRTSVGLVAGGVGLTQLIEATWAGVVGWAIVATGVVFAFVGGARFISTRKKLSQQL